MYFDCIQIISMSCGPTHLLGIDYAPLSNFTAHFVWRLVVASVVLDASVSISEWVTVLNLLGAGGSVVSGCALAFSGAGSSVVGGCALV